VLLQGAAYFHFFLQYMHADSAVTTSHPTKNRLPTRN